MAEDITEHWRNTYGNNALFQAVREQQAEIVEALLELELPRADGDLDRGGSWLLRGTILSSAVRHARGEAGAQILESLLAYEHLEREGDASAALEAACLKGKEGQLLARRLLMDARVCAAVAATPPSKALKKALAAMAESFATDADAALWWCCLPLLRNLMAFTPATDGSPLIAVTSTPALDGLKSCLGNEAWARRRHVVAAFSRRRGRRRQAENA